MLAFVRSLLYLVVLSVTVLLWTPVMLLARIVANPTQMAYLAFLWQRTSIILARWILGIRVRIQGMEHLKQAAEHPQGHILLSKHQSTFETFFLPTIAPRPLAYVFKKELLYIPLFGWAMATLDMVHIDRSKGSAAFNKIITQGRRLLDKGVWVVMFPEGTRTPRGQIGTYKSGATRLACATGAAVIPVAITSARVWPKNRFSKQAGWVDVSIGPPIASQGREHLEMMQQVQDWIETEMRRLDPQAYTS